MAGSLGKSLPPTAQLPQHLKVDVSWKCSPCHRSKIDENVQHGSGDENAATKEDYMCHLVLPTSEPETILIDPTGLPHPSTPKTPDIATPTVVDSMALKKMLTFFPMINLKPPVSTYNTTLGSSA